ncbi:AAA family ATPase [Propionivibrio sp.]|uniref:AAA family ATPase n=1 Tax=Propionivibrio sp. TaxID=2212460 RepID=UPI003BF16E1F
MSKDLDRAVSALQSLDPNCDRDAWVKRGMAYHAAGGDFDTFDQWSAGADNYTAAGARDAWRSFKDTQGGVTAGALFGMARDAGWTEGTDRKPAPKKATRAAEPPRKPMPGNSAPEVWNRLVPVLVHQYKATKGATGAPNENLRMVPTDSTLTIAMQSLAGALAVPAYAPDGTMQSIQFIPAPGKGKKLNLPGASMSGAWHTVGEIKPSEPVYLCEGIGTAWAVWMATGAAAVVCFGWGNVAKVATALRQSDADARLVICPDVGKESAADKIAAEVGAGVAKMPDGWPDNSDLNDLFMSPDGGFDAVQQVLESASEPPKPEPLLKPVSVFDLFTNPSPPPAFVWDGYLPVGEVSLYGAHGGTGKSTVALMLAVCAALGRPLFGVDTDPCKVLFVSLEDSVRIVRNRLASICRAWLIDPEQLRDRLTVVDGTENPELFSTDDRKAGDVTSSFVEMRNRVQAEGFGLVLIDNASDAFSGDEIVRRQVRAFIRSLKLMAQSANCAVVLLAHINAVSARAKKSESGQDFSGSTAWHNSVRSRLFMSRDDAGLITLEHQKSNLGKLREPLTLEWVDGGFPQVIGQAGFDGTRQQGRGDDDRAISLLKLIAEFEGRGQYCSPSNNARNQVFAVLKSEPAFLSLKLNSDATKRVITQCQRAGWIAPLDYRSAHTNKNCQRWTVTTDGKNFAGLYAPTAPSAPSAHKSTVGAVGGVGAHPVHPVPVGGVGGIAHPQNSAKTGESA